MASVTDDTRQTELAGDCCCCSCGRTHSSLGVHLASNCQSLSGAAKVNSSSSRHRRMKLKTAKGAQHKKQRLTMQCACTCSEELDCHQHSATDDNYLNWLQSSHCCPDNRLTVVVCQCQCTDATTPATFGSVSAQSCSHFICSLQLTVAVLETWSYKKCRQMLISSVYQLCPKEEQCTDSSSRVNLTADLMCNLLV